MFNTYVPGASRVYDAHMPSYGIANSAFMRAMNGTCEVYRW